MVAGFVFWTIRAAAPDRSGFCLSGVKALPFGHMRFLLSLLSVVAD